MKYNQDKETVFQNNFDAFRKQYPSWAARIGNCAPSVDYQWMLSARGDPILRISKDGKTFLLHDNDDPQQEARRQIERLQIDSASVFFFLGLGLGYSLEALLELEAGSVAALLLVERDLEVFIHFLRRRIGVFCSIIPTRALCWEITSPKFWRRLNPFFHRLWAVDSNK